MQPANRPINKNIFNVGFVLLFFLVLVVSNPDKAEFNRYLKSNIQKAKLVAGPTKWDVGLTTERDNYFFLSIYKIGVFDNKQTFVGVLGHFIPV